MNKKSRNLLVHLKRWQNILWSLTSIFANVYELWKKHVTQGLREFFWFFLKYQLHLNTNFMNVALSTPDKFEIEHAYPSNNYFDRSPAYIEITIGIHNIWKVLKIIFKTGFAWTEKWIEDRYIKFDNLVNEPKCTWIFRIHQTYILP